MTQALRIEEEAEREILEAAQWYERQRRGLGAELLAMVDGVLNQLTRFPRAGAYVPQVPRDLGTRRVPVGKFPYHLIYVEMADAIRVLAFAHDRRRPGYWLSRLSR